jgi:hypothetical protein
LRDQLLSDRLDNDYLTLIANIWARIWASRVAEALHLLAILVELSATSCFAAACEAESQAPPACKIVNYLSEGKYLLSRVTAAKGARAEAPR